MTTNETVERLRPFDWQCTRHDNGDEYHSADTPFGSYHVDQSEGEIAWSYLFDEYYDQGRERCDSIEDGKKKAWEHWCIRMAPALAEHAADDGEKIDAAWLHQIWERGDKGVAMGTAFELNELSDSDGFEAAIVNGIQLTPPVVVTTRGQLRLLLRALQCD